MRRCKWITLIAATLLAGCAGKAPSPAPDPRALASATSASAASPVPGPPPTPAPRLAATTELAPGRSESLPFAVRPTSAGKAAVLVHSDALAGFSYVRRVDASQKQSPVKVLVGRHPSLALDTTPPVLLSSDGARLCVEGFEPGDAPACHAIRADAALLVGARIWLLEQRPEPEPEEDPDKPRPKPTPGKAAQPVQRPLKMHVWIHELEADGTRAGEARDSGLVFEMPLVGMGLLGAAGTKKGGARLLLYEHKAPRSDGKRWIPQARVVTLDLDASGKPVPRSRATLYEGDRNYGFIDGHDTPQLIVADKRGVVVGRTLDMTVKPPKTGWESYSLATAQSLSAPDTIYAVDPLRLATGAPVKAAELAIYQTLWAEAPRLVDGQPASDAARVAWAGARGFFLKGGKLFSAAKSDGVAAAEAEPFVARRAHLAWGHVEPGGAGLALADGELVEAASDGAVTKHAGVAAATAPLGPPVRIGQSWWLAEPRGGHGSGAAIVRLLPSRSEAATLSARAYADGHALVGGAHGGLFVAIAGKRLEAWKLAEDGSVALLEKHASPFARGIAAAPRKAGGALVVGRRAEAPRDALALALDAAGALVGARSLSLPGAGALAITPRAGGGAIVHDADRTAVVWLDDDGAELAAAAWPADLPRIACGGGAPIPARIPAEAPGQLERLGRLAGDPCSPMPLPQRMADGSIRWIGTQTSGIDEQAVLASLPASPADAAQPLASASAALPSANAGAKPLCPADMVSIDGAFCIDRYETQLVDGADGVALSPDYPAYPGILPAIIKAWSGGRWLTGDLHARAMPLPPLLRDAASAPQTVSRSRAGVRPSGYLTWFVAEQACAAAGKRLCKLEEWRKACRGEQGRRFPYGDDFKHGECNVHRFAHPAATLHGSAAVGHLDPRLDRVLEAGEPLLRETGATPSCASRWGDDAVYDMVGNLDEWIDDKKAGFAGGFFSRTIKTGCEALITAHPKRYLDYSLGTRCCSAP